MIKIMLFESFSTPDFFVRKWVDSLANDMSKTCQDMLDKIKPLTWWCYEDCKSRRG